MVTPTQKISTPLSVISLEPKAVIVKHLCSTNIASRKVPPVLTEKVVEADEVSLISSGFDEQMDLPHTTNTKIKDIWI